MKKNKGSLIMSKTGEGHDRIAGVRGVRQTTRMYYIGMAKKFVFFHTILQINIHVSKFIKEFTVIQYGHYK